MLSGGIYLSLPFCLSHCHYCSNPAAAYSDSGATGYAARLVDDLKAHAPNWRGHRIDSIYLGGGTPTLFSADQLGELLDTVRRHYRVANDAEITTEANPETVTGEVAVDLTRLGINRISIGAQSFQPGHLLALGRRHRPEAVPTAVEHARRAGFCNLSLDLIFGIPGQTTAQWAADLCAAVALKPDHLSAYILTLENDTVLMSRVAAGKAAAPDEATCADLYVQGATTLEAAGYRRYEVSSFARPGHRCRHNLNYWQGGDWLGVGAGAGASLNGVRSACTATVADYMDAQAGAQTIHGEPLSPLEQAHDLAIFAMRTADGADLAAIAQRTGIDLAKNRSDSLVALEADGLIRRHGQRIRPTARGFLFNDSIGQALALG